MDVTNFRSYLQAIFGSNYKVVNERDLDFTSSDKTTAVISVQAGNYFEKTANYPFVLSIYTTDIDSEMVALNTMVETYRTKKWNIGDYTVTNAFQTPVVYNPNIAQIGTNIYAQIIITGSFLAMESPLDLEYITIDGVDYKPLSPNLSATTHAKSAPEKNSTSSSLYSGKAVSEYVEETNTFTIYSYNDVFCKKLLLLKHGQLDPDTVYAVTYHYTSIDISENCIVTDPAFVKPEFTSLPKWQFTLKSASSVLS